MIYDKHNSIVNDQDLNECDKTNENLQGDESKYNVSTGEFSKFAHAIADYAYADNNNKPQINVQVNLMKMIQALDKRLQFMQNHLDEMNSNFDSLTVDLSSRIDTCKNEISCRLDSLDHALFTSPPIQSDIQVSNLLQANTSGDPKKRKIKSKM